MYSTYFAIDIDFAPIIPYRYIIRAERTFHLLSGLKDHLITTTKLLFGRLLNHYYLQQILLQVFMTRPNKKKND